MPGVEFTSNGIQNPAVSRLRDLLAKIAGTLRKGMLVGTFITGILQSGTPMTVMVVGP